MTGLRWVEAGILVKSSRGLEVQQNNLHTTDRITNTTSIISQWNLI